MRHTSRHTLSLCLALTLCLTHVACAGKQDAPSDADAASTATHDAPALPPDAIGEWTLIEIDGTPVSSQETTLTLSESMIGGSTGCNDYGASYDTPGNTLQIRDLSFTERACMEEARMQQERLFLERLGATTSARLDGESLLLLDSSGHTLRFVRPSVP